MKITASKSNNRLEPSDLLIALVDDKALSMRSPKGIVAVLDEASQGSLRAEIKRTSYTPKIGTQLGFTLSNPQGPRHVVLLGVSLADRSPYGVAFAPRRIGAQIFELAQSRSAKNVVVETGALNFGAGQTGWQALIEGVLLSGYRFVEYKQDKKRFEIENLQIRSTQKISTETISRAGTVASAVCFARDLINRGPNDCKPALLVREAERVAKEHKLSIAVVNRAELRKMKAQLMLSVFDSSNEEPFLIKLHYKPKGVRRKKIGLLGKGVTFDSGGLCIKSGPGMYQMKDDMSGAAAVLATVEAAAKLRLPVEIVAFMPVTENMINERSTKPGNVVSALNGKSVEILNTDAEGRLILGDTLVLAEREKCDALIDLATLTGSVANFWGSDYAALFSTDQKLQKDLLAAAELASERLAPVPLAPEYRERLKSGVADIKNIGTAEAGGIIAALFLNEFVEKTPWAHIDIAGPSYSESDKNFIKKGGVGFGVRTLLHYLGAR